MNEKADPDAVLPVWAYCAYCRQRQPVRDATLTRTKQGRGALLGSCACCGTRVWRFYAWNQNGAEEHKHGGR